MPTPLVSNPVPVRLSPEVTLPEGIDLDRLARCVADYIRAHHPAPEPLPHEGAPVEAVTIAGFRRQREGVRVEVRYFVDRYPNSRDDKSQISSGHLIVDAAAGEVARGRLGPLRGP